VPAFDDGTLDAAGKNVIVVGGGDTAMDCVRTAVRQGAKSVKCLYRRNRANMPGSQREVYHAEEEGVEFVWLSAPVAFIGKDGGKTKRKGPEPVAQVRVQKMRLGIADSSGRQTPEAVPGADVDMDADIVIMALGFDPEDVPEIFGQRELALTKWGTLKINHRTMMTNLDGVFAAGDIVRGASLVVWAIRDGRDAAVAIHKHIEAKTAGAGFADAAE
jgi:glutamate synthase (NADPH) small chain